MTNWAGPGWENLSWREASETRSQRHLDDDPGVRPIVHIHTAFKAPWFDITDTLPQFAQMPPAPG
jgi:hypothetical protein